jgi:hypothetical protein
MGQQQLLLLVLGVITVGLATMLGIQAFEENHFKAKEDRERLKLLDFASQAQVWKLKPSMFGGGQNGDPADFSNFKLRSIGAEATGKHGSDSFVNISGVGCFKFFATDTYLRIHALNKDCIVGSWTKAVVITGSTPDDITYEQRMAEAG